MAGIRVASGLRAPATAFVLTLAACQSAPPGKSPQAAAPPAVPPARLTLKLYAGSSTGLVVGEAPTGGNPASQLQGQSFVDNPGLAKTFIWSFPEDATMLDGSCQTITRTQAINIANSPGANTVVFTESSAGGGKDAPIKAQILPAHADASTC